MQAIHDSGQQALAQVLADGVELGERVGDDRHVDGDGLDGHFSTFRD